MWTEPTTPPTPIYFLGACKRCKRVVRLTVATYSTNRVHLGYDRWETRYRWTFVGAIADRWGRTEIQGSHGRVFLPCPSGCLERGVVNPAPEHVAFRRVVGVYSDKKECNDKCLSAKGPSCECKCAGANHGSGHTFISAAASEVPS